MQAVSIAVGITTAKRPNSTVIASLASLRAAGCDLPVTIFDDGCGLSFKDPAVQHEVNRPMRGPFMNWCHALDRLLATGERWQLLLEDDITWAVGAWSALLAEIPVVDREFPDLGLYSIYLAQVVSEKIERRNGGPLAPGLYRFADGKAGGSQAYLFRRDGAEWLLSQSERFRQQMIERNVPFDPSLGIQNKNRNRDNVVTACLADGGKALVFRSPGLVSHAPGSGNSSYYPKAPQETVYFAPSATPLARVSR